ncbi:MAG: hypothetical protein ONB27_06290 [candidate division KSB1 bacterium]|nr:hypothetical protein [candidate division KSB1 bacterium]
METTSGEKEKQLLAATVRERLIGNKNYILYKELLDKKLPAFLKNYLQNSVQKFIYTEEPLQFNNSTRYDFEDEKINRLKNELIKAFEEVTVFSFEELTSIINHTVALQYDFLVKPGATLLNIFYRNKSDQVQTEILRVLEALDDQRIYIQTLIRNVKEFEQYHIVEDNFRNLLAKTEEETYSQNFMRSFISDVSAFANFLELIYGSEDKKLCVDHVKLLLVERDLQQYLSTFDQYNGNNIDVDDIASILIDYLVNKRIKRAKEVDSVVDEIERFITESLGEERIDEAVEEQTEIYQTEIDQSFSGAASVPTKLAPAISREGKKKKHPKITHTWKDPLDMIIDRRKIEEQPTVPVESLLALIDLKDEKFIKKRVFGDDDTAYQEFIRQLDALDNWKEAKKYIEDELMARGIDSFSKEALRITDLAFERYFPKKR